MSDQIQIYGYNIANKTSTGAVRLISIYDGVSEGWTFQAPPTDIPEGRIAYYFGPNWVVSDGYGCAVIEPPPQTEPQVI
jgi:hypothetical protein